MVPHFPIDKTLRTWKLQSLSLTDEICNHLKQSIKKTHQNGQGPKWGDNSSSSGYCIKI